MAETTAAHTTSNQERAKTGGPLVTRKGRILSWAKDHAALFGIIGACVAVVGFAAHSLYQVEQRVGEKLATIESSLIAKVDGQKELMTDLESDMQTIATTMQNYHTEQSRAMEEIRRYLFDHQAHHTP